VVFCPSFIGTAPGGPPIGRGTLSPKADQVRLRRNGASHYAEKRQATAYSVLLCQLTFLPKLNAAASVSAGDDLCETKQSVGMNPSLSGGIEWVVARTHLQMVHEKKTN
jgi:hypothetical protein